MFAPKELDPTFFLSQAIYLSIYLSFCLSVCLSVLPVIYLYVCLDSLTEDCKVLTEQQINSSNSLNSLQCCMEYIRFESEDGGGAYKSCLYIQSVASTSYVVSLSSRVMVADSLSVYASRPINLICL